MRFLLIIILLSPSYFSLAQEATLSLPEAINKALEHNLNILIAEKSVEMATNAATSGNAGMQPTFDLTGSYTGSLTNTKLVFAGSNPPIDVTGAQTVAANAAANLNYTLFGGYRATNTLNQLQAQQKLSEAQARAQIENIILQMAQAYYNALQLQESIQVAQDRLRTSQLRLRRVLLRVQMGSANKIEALNAEVDRNNDSLNVMNLKQMEQVSLQNINYLFGNTQMVSYQLDKQLAFVELDKANLEQALEQNNSQVIRSKRQKEVTDWGVEIAKAARFPIINLTSGYSFSNTQSDASFILENQSAGLNGGLTLSYRLFNGGRAKIQLLNAQIQAESQELQLEDTKRAVKLQFENAYTLYENNLALAQLQEQTVAAAELNLSRSEQLFNSGQINGTQFREAQLNFANARFQWYAAQISAKLAELELLTLAGKLIE